MIKFSFIVAPVIEDEFSCLRADADDRGTTIDDSFCKEIIITNLNWENLTNTGIGTVFDSTLSLTTKYLDVSLGVPED